VDAFNAALEYLGLKYFGYHPDGRTDKGGRWYPAMTERNICCDSVRKPTRSYPWSLWKHCHSLKHVACKYGLEESEIRFYFRKNNLPLFLASDNPRVREWVEKQLTKPAKPVEQVIPGRIYAGSELY
jgi:hypothetical protein